MCPKRFMESNTVMRLTLGWLLCEIPVADISLLLLSDHKLNHTGFIRYIDMNGYRK